MLLNDEEAASPNDHFLNRGIFMPESDNEGGGHAPDDFVVVLGGSDLLRAVRRIALAHEFHQVVAVVGVKPADCLVQSAEESLFWPCLRLRHSMG